ncbi:MAG: TPM domain-containing protein [Verrucomicrobiaceae bacterium]
MRLHRYLGNQWVRLERVTDAAHCLRLEDLRRIEVVLDDFERNFPQAFFAAYLGVLPIGLSVAELGFWLLNQGAFNTHSVSRRNDFGIILVVDPATQSVGITLGYTIEHWFPTKIVQRILADAAIHLRKRGFGSAIEIVCQQSAQILQKHGQRAPWHPGAAGNLDASPDMGLQPLRSGHRPGTRPRAGMVHQTS